MKRQSDFLRLKAELALDFRQLEALLSKNRMATERAEATSGSADRSNDLGNTRSPSFSLR